MAQGTIKVTNGSVDVVGTGTAFTSMKAGSFLTFVLTGVAYTVAIDSIQSATALKLAVKFDGPTTSGVAFNESPVGSMALATMGVTVQAQKALRMMIADQTNWREVFSNKQTITVTLPDGTQYSGYSWGYISDMLKTINVPALEAIRDQTVAARNQAQTYATNASNSATAASTANTGAQAAKTAAETARTGAQTAQQGAAASATTAGTAATTATNKATEATNQAALAKQYADSINPANLLAKANNLSDVPDKPTARTNLQLGLNDSPEFSAIYARAGIEVRTLSDGTGPSGSLVARRASANGATIVSSENRANSNGSVEWIKRDSNGTPRGVTLTEDNYVQYNGMVPAPPAIEVGLKSGAGASYVDFHYDGTKGYDYSARIICDGMNSEQRGGGNLRVYSGFTQLSSIAQTNITGGRLYVNTSDAVFATQVGMANGSIQVPAAADATAPIGAGLRGIHAGADSANFNNASNINLYSWYGIGFCTAYTSPTNGVIQGKPAVYIDTRTGTLNAKGAVQANGVTLTSDWNAKEDVTIIDPMDALDKIGRLDGYTFRYKLSDSKRLTAGALAQDLDLVIPDLVIKPEATPEVDADGNVVIDEETGKPVNDGDSYLTADYMGLIGYLLAAVKGAKIKVEALEEKVLSLGGSAE